MSDDIDPRVHESSRWRAEMFDAIAKMHTKVTVLEGRVGAGLGVGDDDGKFGKLSDRVNAMWRAAVFAVCTAVVSLGSANSAAGAVFPVIGGNRGGVCTVTGTASNPNTLPVVGAVGSRYVYDNASPTFWLKTGSSTWTQVTVP